MQNDSGWVDHRWTSSEVVGAAIACNVVRDLMVGESVCDGYTLEAYGRITRRDRGPSRVDQHITRACGRA